MVGICPRLLSLGACTTDDCTFNHDVHLCPTCRIWCLSERALQAHLAGKKHKIQLRAQGRSDCRVCNVPLGSPLAYTQHVKGRAHRSSLEEQQEGGRKAEVDDAAVSSVDAGVSPGQVSCEVCDVFVPSRFLSSHITGIKHRKKERFTRFQAAFDEADKDKNGINVSHGQGVDFGFVDMGATSTQPTKSIDVMILLTSPERIDITDIRMSSALAHRPRPSNFKVVLDEMIFPTRIWFQKPFNLTVNFDPRSLAGRFYDRLELVFLDTALQTQFVITRPLCAIVSNQADWELMKPSAPYKPKSRSKQEPEKEVIPGVKPPALSAIKWVAFLPQAPIPRVLEVMLSNPNLKFVADNLKRNWLPPVLDAGSYGRHFKTLLHVEEVTMSIDIQRYDDEDVLLEPVFPYFRLAVPGLSEKRPSVVVGDSILIQNQGSSTGRWFEGHVHRIRQIDVDLKFHASFNSYKGQKYNVRFKLGRLPLRRMHQALATTFQPERVLFPSQVHVRGRQAPTKMQVEIIRTVNRLIQTNPPQLLAVTTILHMPRGSVPFVLFGPPGTGKTVTVVEAMRQILLSDPDARILACAPSNSAADLIAERLKDNLSPNSLFRLNAPSRDKQQLPRSLVPFSKSNSDGTFFVPPLEVLLGYRVIVSTCISASVPYGIGIPRGHFTHIFIDEAGQACEPEAMIPIKTMADTDTNIILSGDPKQLGPIIRSTVARDLGLGISYLDRLMALDIYNAARGHGISVVKLIKNWRSHPAILKYPNEQFYKGELEPHGDVVITHSLLRSHEIVEPGYPVVFHAITGNDMQEGSSPSFFNPDEASQVRRYVEALRSDRRLRLEDEHIGVIAPYHAQVMKIRKLLHKSYSGLKIGSVEEFQGQERRVIIISTVRSSVNFVQSDIKNTLGFVANPRRFNVAITRAQALLIVIGDSSVLSLDPLWRGFMNYICLSGGWKGKGPDWDPAEPIVAEGGYDAERRQAAESDMEQLIERTRTMILKSKRSGILADRNKTEAYVDLPWREVE